MSRVKRLQKELTVAQAHLKNLVMENRDLKMIERRQGDTLSRYEKMHSQLPRMIKSYSEDVSLLQTRLRQMKKTYQNLKNIYRMQTVELQAAQKQYKHLLDLTKNKQLGERKKLSNQLEQAEMTIKQQEQKAQNLSKKIALQDKNYQVHIMTEIRKVNVLSGELMKEKKTNKKLKSNLKKLVYQKCVGYKQNYMWKTVNSLGALSEPKAQSMSSSSNGVCDNGSSDHATAFSDSLKKSFTPELVHDDSDTNDRPEDLEKTLMRQVHEDIINKPDMIINMDPGSSDSSDTKSWLERDISELTQEKYLSPNEYNGNIVHKIKTNVVGNPFTLSYTSRLKPIGNRQRLLKGRFGHDDNDGEDDSYVTENGIDDDEEDDVSSISSVSDSE